MIFSERFVIIYMLTGLEQEALAKTKDICVEQTVEFPPLLSPAGMIQNHIVGRIESFEPWGQVYKARISYANETTANELTQLLNVILGNIRIKLGIRVERIELSPSLLERYKGPRFGWEGLRALLNVQ
jgi:ribulose-bisphosphate carboxylase large chain